MAKKKKKKTKYKDGMMKKFADKKFETYNEHEPLVKSGAATTTDVKPNNKDMFNRADNALNQLTKNVGIPRQKVRMK